MDKPNDNQDEYQDHAMNHTISRNVAASMLSKIYYLATRFFIPPFVLAFVTLEEYGIWSYCFILLSYLGMSVFGVTNVYVRYSAVWWAKGETEKINQLLSTGIFSISLLCLLIFPLFAFGLPYLFPILNIPDSLHTTAYTLILGTTCIFMINLTLGAFSFLLQSLQMIVIDRVIATIAWTLEAVFIVTFLLMGFGIYSLIMAFTIFSISSILMKAWICYSKIPSLKISPRMYNKEMLKKFFYFGGVVQLAGLFSIARRSMEKIFAGMFLGVQATGLYELGTKFPNMATSIPESINAVFLPTTSHLYAKEKKDKIIGIYFHGSRYINILTGLIMGFLAAFSTPLISAWLGLEEKYQVTAVILSWFTIALQLNILTGPASAIYRSINRPKKELLYGILLISLFIGIAFPVLSVFGASFTLINTLIVSITVFSALCYIIHCNHFLRVSQWEFAKKVMLPGLVPYGLGFGLSALTSRWFEAVAHHRWETLFTLIGVWAVYTITAPLILFFFFCDQEERNQIWNQLLHTLSDLILGKPPPAPVNNEEDPLPQPVEEREMIKK